MYDIDIKEVKNNLKSYIFYAFVLIFFITIIFISLSGENIGYTMEFTIIVSIIVVGFGMAFIKVVLDLVSTIKILNMIKRLQKTGKLFKNVPFFVDWKTNHFVTVTFSLSDGSMKSFTRKFIYYDKRFDEERFIDIVLDENNIKDYYIGFNINRIGGNLKEDYYIMDSEDTIKED